VPIADGVSVADSDGSLLSYLRIQTVDDPQPLLGHKLGAWITEFGFPTYTASGNSSQFAPVTERVQAAYHARALIQALSYGVQSWCVYELADEGQNPSDAEQNFGLVRSAALGFEAKTAFYTLKRITRLLGAN